MPAAPAAVPFPASALYVGNLHPDVSEAILFEKFSTAGPVLSIRVCRDMITRRSLGYAYVNFQNVADAERALDTMNFDVMKGRQIRIMWSQRDPSLRKSGVGNVYMKNLDTSIDNKALYDTFSAFGNILSCKVATDEAGNSKGFGFVHFETEDAASQAINKVNGMMLNGKKVFVAKFVPRVLREQSENADRFNNVFVKNFGDDLDDEKLRDLFSKFGTIISLKVVKDTDGTPKGFGFVAFQSSESAEEAVKEVDGLEVNGKKLFCGPAMTKAKREAELKKKFEAMKTDRQKRSQGVNLYVKNLDDSIDDARLVREFSAFGNITSSKIMTEDGRSRGFGFVCYTTPEEATRAVTELNGRILGSKPLYVALAQRKDERKAQLATQHMQRLASIRLQQTAPPLYGARPVGPMMNVPGFPAPPMHRYMPPRVPQPYGMPPTWSHGGQGLNRLPIAAPSPFQPPMHVPGVPTFRPRATPHPGHPMFPMRFPGFSQTRPVAGGPLIPNHPMQDVSNRNAGGYELTRKPLLSNQGTVLSPAGSSLPFEYTSSARNAFPLPQLQKQEIIQRQEPPQPQPAVVVEGLEPLTASMLAAAPLEQQKQMLGERLFPLIRSIHPDAAGKITGMLLEIDNAELLHMLENFPILRAKVEEALNVLQLHMTKRVAGDAIAGPASS